MVAAPDKFRGTATAREVAAAVARAAAEAGWTCDEAPVSDGGEGFCDVLGRRGYAPCGSTARSGAPALAVAPAGRLDGGSDRPWSRWRWRRAWTWSAGPRATTRSGPTPPGTGELIAAAVKAGARRVLVGMGGSATTDGGWAALEVLEPHSRLAGVELLVACDVTTRFVDAAAVFAPQKGASPRPRSSCSPAGWSAWPSSTRSASASTCASLEGSGAAGGLAGGLAAIGATLVPGFELVADAIELAERIEGADLVVTGEGFLDEQSFHGKAVGGVVALAAEAGVPVLVVAGDGARRPAGALSSPWSSVRAGAGVGDTLDCVADWSPSGCGAGRERRLTRRAGTSAPVRPSCGGPGPRPAAAARPGSPASGSRPGADQRRRPTEPASASAGPVEGQLQDGQWPEAQLGRGAGCGGPARPGRTGRGLPTPKRSATSISSAEVDAVAADEGHRLEHRPPGRALAGQAAGRAGPGGERRARSAVGPSARSPGRLRRAGPSSGRS